MLSPTGKVNSNFLIIFNNLLFFKNIKNLNLKKNINTIRLKLFTSIEAEGRAKISLTMSATMRKTMGSLWLAIAQSEVIEHTVK